MRSNRKLRWVGVLFVVGVVVFWLAASPGQGQRKYEVETRVYTSPEYRTDAARAIDAYERVMQRYMDVAERNFITITADIKAVDTKLTAIDAKLAKLDTRMERIERHLGIIPTPPPDPNRVKLIGPDPTQSSTAIDR